MQGENAAESLRQYPLRKGDHILADRGYSHASGLYYAADQGAFVAVRLDPDGIHIEARIGQPFKLQEMLHYVQKLVKWSLGKFASLWKGSPPCPPVYASFAKPKPPSNWHRPNSGAEPTSTA